MAARHCLSVDDCGRHQERCDATLSRSAQENGVSVQMLTDRYPAIARLTKAARRFGNLGSFLARVVYRTS
jgi:hypothetical protein